MKIARRLPGEAGIDIVQYGNLIRSKFRSTSTALIRSLQSKKETAMSNGNEETKKIHIYALSGISVAAVIELVVQQTTATVPIYIAFGAFVVAIPILSISAIWLWSAQEAADMGARWPGNERIKRVWSFYTTVGELSAITGMVALVWGYRWWYGVLMMLVMSVAWVIMAFVNYPISNATLMFLNEDKTAQSREEQTATRDDEQ